MLDTSESKISNRMVLINNIDYSFDNILKIMKNIFQKKNQLSSVKNILTTIEKK